MHANDIKTLQFCNKEVDPAPPRALLAGEKVADKSNRTQSIFSFFPLRNELLLSPKVKCNHFPEGPRIRQEQHHRKCQIAYLLKEKMLQCHRPSQAFALWFLKCARLGFGASFGI